MKIKFKLGGTCKVTRLADADLCGADLQGADLARISGMQT